ncbi:MAG: hypothetical protein Q9169_001765 [Polycauliona sp. 2 TL-2023]
MPESKVESAHKPSAVDKAAPPEGNKDGQKSSTLQKSGTGTWRRGSKATPVTQVAKESIFAATDKASELVSAARNPLTQGIVGSKRSASTHLCRNIESPSGSPSLDASIKKTPGKSASLRDIQGSAQTPGASINPSDPDKDPTAPHDALQEKTDPEKTIDSATSNTASSKESELNKPKVSNDAPLWRAWFSRHEEPSDQEPEPPEAIKATDKSNTNTIETPMQRRVSNPELATKAAGQANVSRTWLGLWGTNRTSGVEPTDTAASTPLANTSRPQSSSNSNTAKIETNNPTLESQPVSTAKPPGWAFWSRDTTKSGEGNATDCSVGELALAGSPSQSHPESAVLEESSGVLGKRPRSVGSAGKLGTSQSQKKKIQKEVPVEPKGKVASDRPVERKPPENDSTKNLLLPQITATYSPIERPSFFQSLSRLWYHNRTNDAGPVELTDSSPRIKRALTISPLLTCAGTY